jgi:hypothetical protein
LTFAFDLDVAFDVGSSLTVKEQGGSGEIPGGLPKESRR